MLCTAPEVCLAMSQSRGTRVIQEWLTGQRSKLSLVTSGLRNFLDYGGGKRVRRKGYDDASLTPIRIALSRKQYMHNGAAIWNSCKRSVEAASTI